MNVRCPLHMSCTIFYHIFVRIKGMKNKEASKLGSAILCYTQHGV